MQRIIFAVFASVITGCLGDGSDLHLKKASRLKVCSYASFEPISYNQGEGYEGDIIRAAAKTWGVPVKFHRVYKFDGMWLRPSNGSCDLVMGGMAPIDKRKEEGAVFSDVTSKYNQSLLVRKADKDSGKITGYESFADGKKKIGVIEGSTGASYADQLVTLGGGDPDKVLVKFQKEDMLKDAFKDGKVDAIARDDIVNEYQAENDDTLLVIGEADFGEGYAYSVDPKNPVLLAELNKEICKLTQNGAISVEDWLEDPKIFEAPPKDIAACNK